jgi:hypothetical protein
LDKFIVALVATVNELYTGAEKFEFVDIQARYPATPDIASEEALQLRTTVVTVVVDPLTGVDNTGTAGGVVSIPKCLPLTTVIEEYTLEYPWLFVALTCQYHVPSGSKGVI